MESILSFEWNETAHQLWRVKRERKELEKKESKLMKKLTYKLAAKTYQSYDFIFTPIERIGTIQYKEIPELQKVNLDVYRGDPIVIWKVEKK